MKKIKITKFVKIASLFLIIASLLFVFTDYVIAQISVGGNVYPWVTTNNATNIGATQMTLNASDGMTGVMGLNNPQINSECFEWGTSSGSYSQSWCQTPSNNQGSGSYSYTITGLNSNTTYYFQAYVTGSNNAYGGELSATTYTYCGLRAYYKKAIHSLDCQAGGNSPLKISKKGTIYSIILVSTSSPIASPIRVETKNGVYAIASG